MSEFSGWRDWEKPDYQEGLADLQIRGWNAKVRHPLYLASLLIFWGMVVFLPHQVMLLTAVISSLYLIIGIRLEERKLLEVFGEAYRKYQKEVPMIWPW